MYVARAERGHLPKATLRGGACFECPADQFSFCGQLQGAALVALRAAARPVRYRAGQLLYEEGAPATRVFSMTAGSASRYKMLPDGRRTVIGFLFDGDLTGTLEAATYDCTVEAISAVDACVIDRAQFERLQDAYPDIRTAVFRHACGELDEAQDHLLLLGRPGALTRVAGFLLYLSEAAASRRQPFELIEVPMSRVSIADYLGVTPETVSRAIAELTRCGTIELLTASRIRIVSKADLQRIAAGT